MSDPNVIPSPEDPRRAAAAQLAGSKALEGADPTTKAWFDRMMDPNDEEINAAADAAPAYVANQAAVPGQIGLRQDYWKPATPEQVANAAARGYDLTQQEKYTVRPADK